MRISFHSPMPPSESGIADYSAALLVKLCELADVEVNGEPRRGDVAVYQIGNNAFHVDAYNRALANPGVVVLHEANLHHLQAERTIRKGDWDEYMREVAYDGGTAALDYAQRVRALEVGPDYDGVPMLRRLLDSARGLIVHSHYVEQQARQAGYHGPVAVIPHGTWIPQVDPQAERARLGLSGDDPLVGIFGHMKPYKRIPQVLRAFARVAKEDKRIKLILGGAEHPELPLEPILHQLGLNGNVRRLGGCDEREFTGAIAACDIVVNLRYPTVGETSGTLMRAMGMAKATMVSDVGAFAEFPDDVCLRVPVGGDEDELLYQYLKLLAARPDLRGAMGARARQWAQRECAWDNVAEKYVAFLKQIALKQVTARPAPAVVKPAPLFTAVDLEEWAQSDSLEYLRSHMARLTKTLEMTPRGGPQASILEMGAYMQITPLLARKLGYGQVRGSYLGPKGVTDHKRVVSSMGDIFECRIDLFDAERDTFPYPDASFETVICGELVEHLTADPMHMMSEINRILKPNGHLVLTTPNAASVRAIASIMDSYHPGFFTTYMRPDADGTVSDPRHSREYTAKEAYRLAVDAGFDVERIETGEFSEGADAPYAWVEQMLAERGYEAAYRGDGTYILARKASPVRDRWPGWLYS